MKSTDLQPIGTFARRFGVKAVVYGPPGQGKTPVVATTTPRPVVCLTEPGANSLRDIAHIPAWNAIGDPDKVIEFVKWAHTPDAKNFDTLIFDSGSEFAEALLGRYKEKYTNKLKAYGDMATEVFNEFAKLYYLEAKNVVIICKETEVELDGTYVKRPYFPGQELNVRIPHLYDAILRQATTSIPGVPTPQLAVRTKGTVGISARARLPEGSTLQELEFPNYSAIFDKLK